MAEAEKKNIADLAQAVNTTTLRLVLLTIATGGIWAFLYMREKHAQIQEITGFTDPNPKMNNKAQWDAVPIIGMVVLAWSPLLIPLFPAMAAFWPATPYLIAFCWSDFFARKAIQQYAMKEFMFDYKMNSILAFFFHVFYVNYKINCLAEQYQVNKAMRGETPPTAKQD